MPEFSNVFSGNAKDKKLTPNEIVRAIRYNIAAEYETIQFYEQLAESIDNEDVKKILYEVANDERVHAGNFLKILKILHPQEEAFYVQGAQEVDEILKKD